MLTDLGMSDSPTVTMEDNQGDIAITKNPVNHSKHRNRLNTDIHYHYIGECVQNGQIRVQYCPTVDMKADMLTKPLTRQKFEYLRGEIGLYPV